MKTKIIIKTHQVWKSSRPSVKSGKRLFAHVIAISESGNIHLLIDSGAKKFTAVRMTENVLRLFFILDPFHVLEFREVICD